MKKLVLIVVFFAVQNSNAQLQNMNSACEQNPCQALPICSTTITNPYSYQSNTGNPGVLTSGGCGNSIGGYNVYEQNWIYYQFTCYNTGILNFTITPNDPLGDLDWALWNITNTDCSAIASTNLVECNSFVGTGPTGMQPIAAQGFEPQITGITGNTYILGISRRAGGTNTTPPLGPPYSNGSAGFSIIFTGTATVFNTLSPALSSIEPFDASLPVTQLTIKLNQKVRCYQVGPADFSFTGGGVIPSFTTTTGNTCPGCTGVTGFNWSNASDKVTLTFVSPLPGGNYTLSLNGVNPFASLCGIPANTAITLPLTIANLDLPDFQHQKITQFPNPAHTKWTVQAKEPIKSIRCYSQQGKIIKTLLGHEETYTIDVSTWGAGVYFVTIETNNETHKLKFVKN